MSVTVICSARRGNATSVRRARRSAGRRAWQQRAHEYRFWWTLRNRRDAKSVTHSLARGRFVERADLVGGRCRAQGRRGLRCIALALHAFLLLLVQTIEIRRTIVSDLHIDAI